MRIEEELLKHRRHSDHLVAQCRTHGDTQLRGRPVLGRCQNDAVAVE